MLGYPLCVYNVVDLITIGTEMIQSKGLSTSLWHLLYPMALLATTPSTTSTFEKDPTHPETQRWNQEESGTIQVVLVHPNPGRVIRHRLESGVLGVRRNVTWPSIRTGTTSTTLGLPPSHHAYSHIVFTIMYLQTFAQRQSRWHIMAQVLQWDDHNLCWGKSGQ